MRTIKWHLDIGLANGDREDEVEVEDNATDEQIDAIVREEVFNFIEWSWTEERRLPPAEKEGK